MHITSLCIDRFFAVLSGEPVVAGNQFSHGFAHSSKTFSYVSEEDLVSLKISLRDQIYRLFMSKHIRKEAAHFSSPTLRKISHSFKVINVRFSCHCNHRKSEKRSPTRNLPPSICS